MRFLLLIAIGFLAGNAAAEEAAGDFRTWTDTRQRQIEAALVRVDGGNVVLKTRAGDELTVSILNLSATDRERVKEQNRSPNLSEKTAESAAEAESGPAPAAAADWPRTVALKDTPTVKVIREDAEKKEFVYETEHYEFVCDSPLGANLVREFSRVFEATWLVNCVLPLDFKPAPERGRTKFRARIFTDQSDYLEAGGAPGSAGIYGSSDKELKLPLSSLGVKMFGSRVVVNYLAEDYRTLIHEITHQMMNHWLGRLPTWYVEGSAEYVELAKYENGRLSFLRQDQRLEEQLSRLASNGGFQMVPLEKLMTIDSRSWMSALGSDDGAAGNYASALALTYYFYHLDGDGKGTHFKEYIRAVEKLGRRENGASLVKEYLLRDRDYKALQKDVQKSFRRVGIRVEFEE